MKVPIAQPVVGEEERQAVDDVMRSGQLTMGPRVKRFEEEWAKYVGTKYAIMVNSGSSANLLMLSAYKSCVGRGEVITPAVTWATTVFPIAQVGLKPVLVDVDYDFNISIEAIRQAITSKTKAIFPVHLLGNPARMEEIVEIAEENDLDILEDCCEAHGAEVNGFKVGTFGEMGTFSFFMSHHITCGEGGMIVTNNDDWNDQLRSLRVFGWTRDMKYGDTFARANNLDPRWCFAQVGYNLRPTEMNATIGLVQFPRLEKWISVRRSNAYWFNNNLCLTGVKERYQTRNVYLLYGMTTPRRKDLTAFLEQNGIETRPVISGNMTLQPAMKHLKYRVAGSLRNAQRIHDEGFCIGVHPGITTEQQEYVKQKFEEFFK